MREYGISARLTFSNTLLREEDLTDDGCNCLCTLFEHNGPVPGGVILSSDLLLDYLQKMYPGFYFVASTTKVLTDFRQLKEELDRPSFRYVVPDFRLNKAWDRLGTLNKEEKDKVEFLCNEACWFECPDRKACYENVSRKNLGEDCEEHRCVSPYAQRGYRFSDAMKNPGFIGIRDIRDVYLPNGFSQFKRSDPGAPALLSDQTGISAAGSGRDLSEQFPGSVLTGLHCLHRQSKTAVILKSQPFIISPVKTFHMTVMPGCAPG